MLSNVASVCAYEHDKLSGFLTSKNENTPIVAVVGVDGQICVPCWSRSQSIWNQFQVNAGRDFLK